MKQFFENLMEKQELGGSQNQTTGKRTALESGGNNDEMQNSGQKHLMVCIIFF